MQQDSDGIFGRLDIGQQFGMKGALVVELRDASNCIVVNRSIEPSLCYAFRFRDISY